MSSPATEEQEPEGSAPENPENPAPETPAAPATQPAAGLPDAREVIELVRRWLARSRDLPVDPGATRLAGVLKDPDGLDFTLGFVDRVVRPEDLGVAARNLEELARRTPRFLPWYLRAAIALGGAFARILPWLVIPISRRVLRGMVEHLVIDATPAKLDTTLAALRADGRRLNINLLGEAVLGDGEADRRLAGTIDLLGRDDVDYVSVKVSAVASQLSMWGFDETVDRVVQRLLPLYGAAARARTRTFINLDMEEYRDLDLTIAVFTRLLEKPGLEDFEAGIVLQAYLPDSLQALQQLTAWARSRRAAGGAAIKVRIVKGANLAMERVDAAVHGWPLATWGSKLETDAHYKRVLAWLLTPERTDAVRVGIAGHNLFDLAFAWLLAQRRGVESRVEFEMLLGMATAQAEAVRQDVGGLLLYTPVVHPHEFDAAISYLVRRLEENASEENFMSGVFDLTSDEAIFRREAERFAASLDALDARVPAPNRTQDRLSPGVPSAPADFENEPDTDPALAANRAWGRGILERARESRIGIETIERAAVGDAAALGERVRAARAAGVRWGARPASERAEQLDRVGEVLEAFRGRLVEVMAAETGKTIAEADVEVSEAVDFARWYAARARELDAIEGARHVPDALTVVTPPWNFPVAIPAGNVLSALAAGSAVILKPAGQARRCGAVLAEAIWEAGIDRETLTLVQLGERELGQELITAPEVDRVLLVGGSETAELFSGWRPQLPVLGETSGKNAIVITPSADLDLAVADLVKSAFGHAGQKCSAASLAILVGSVGRSERFRRQLVDAVSSIRVGSPFEADTLMGPVIEEPQGKLRRGLTTLGEGESWLVEPRQLGEDPRLWSPGVRDGVRAGSEFHLTEYFGPVLGIMTAPTLEAAIALQNGTDFGLTAGIHSLDPHEVAVWLRSVEAGNLYVNRGTTGAIVRRQSFGGWKRSAVGAGAKAGGPNTLLVLGGWEPEWEAPGGALGNLRLDGLDEDVAGLIAAAQPALDYEAFARVRQGALSDAAAWESEFSVSRDSAALGVERNVFRYRPAEVVVRLGEGGELGELVRVLAAGVLSGARLQVTSAVPLPSGLLPYLSGPAPLLRGASLATESDAAFLARVPAERPERIRLVGGDAAAVREALAGSIDTAVWAGPVTPAGRLELLPFLREQAVSVTAHRFGNPDPRMAALAV
ncbi:bifunctional proline dehydrogenase/L-glutamate gamma-semialdehyde dehydrogenase [Homoserinibacter sp. YIM 151385]|uniref:bifunctional proline dehydrogenase/L-glutamate gamma-semialdehyde dehydrogenase n=1 Tax=Homoserinibacter sp. YIM 151385 TaxID=2985506 RepID=UPI0022F09BDB|nr:bifunctional proline dehydrogenase/L-glutamate gamma-semialdehyde dehydrogenase [Homoserinibacter sp. YIM 151385]WBU37161.1 bifunctional proline dehydrogenase/L-glutamate gamma-semialdehyde dehydrogenase [Homoserinibacter sp. YIM 151385]